jgi:hypothetical protein
VGINRECARGRRKNREGNVPFRKGDKPHPDASGTGFPLAAAVTGANAHGGRPAILAEPLTEKKAPSCYRLMDSAYDSKGIEGFIRDHGRIPATDPNQRKGNGRPPPDPAKREGYNIRTRAERANPHLKDRRIPRAIQVKGDRKAPFVLTAAAIRLAALKYLRRFILGFWNRVNY